jgi:hypothetical protein
MCNGANLFVQALSLFGFGDEVFKRSLADDETAALSLGWENRLYRATHGKDWEDGWRQIGSLSAQTNIAVSLRETGQTRLRLEDGRQRLFETFTDFLTACIVVEDRFFDADGPIDEGYDVLEAEHIHLVAGGISH